MRSCSAAIELSMKMCNVSSFVYLCVRVFLFDAPKFCTEEGFDFIASFSPRPFLVFGTWLNNLLLSSIKHLHLPEIRWGIKICWICSCTCTHGCKTRLLLDNVKLASKKFVRLCAKLLVICRPSEFFRSGIKQQIASRLTKMWEPVGFQLNNCT